MCDVNPHKVYNLKNILDTKTYNRASFVINENQRTCDAAKKLNESKFYDLGSLMYKSHSGLKDLYEVSCDELDFLVDLIWTSSPSVTKI